MTRIDALVAAFAMGVDEFAAAYRGLFFAPASRANAIQNGTVRSTPSARRRSDAEDTAPRPGHDAASYWLALPHRTARLPLLLGRSPLCDLPLVHPSVSRRHAAIWPAESFLELEDVDSQHGTSVRGVALRAGERAVLALGETVRFADIELALLDARGYWSAARGQAR